MSGAHRRLLELGIVVVLALVLAGWRVRPAGAAFDWEPASPRSLVLGDSPVRWPVAGAGPGLRADALWSRPFSWPGLHGGGGRLAFAPRDGSWVIGTALSQLSAAVYRESRLAVGMSRAIERHEVALTASWLQVAAGDPIVSSRSGGALDLAVSLDLGRVAVLARTSGVLETRGARALAEPREFDLALRAGAAPLQAELRVVEGTRGRRVALGFLAAPFAPLVIGAGWSSAEPPVRVAVEIRRERLVLGGGIAWHSELPPTQIVHVARAPGGR